MKRVLVFGGAILIACRATTPTPRAREVVARRPVEKRSQLPWARAAHGDAVPDDGPVIALDGTTIKVDGAAVTTLGGTRTLSLLPQLDDLTQALVEKREAWKAAHAGEPFPGLVVTRLPAKTRIRNLRLIVNSAALAGYPHAYHVVRSGDGSTESAIQLSATVPMSGTAPARFYARLMPGEIAVQWNEPKWEGSIPRDASKLVDGLRAAWARGPKDAREWVVVAEDCDELQTVVELVDGIAVVRAGAHMTVSIAGGSNLKECE